MLKRAFVGVIVSFLLSQAAFSGAISGTVTDQSTGSPISGIWVNAYDYFTGDWYDNAVTDPNGNYTIQDLPSGNCRVEVYSQYGYQDQYYNGQLNYNDAGPVSVTAGVTTSGIDFALIEGGKISGTVTDQSTGSPISNIWVEACDYNTGDYYSYTDTDLNGNYTIQGLPSGNYRVSIYFQNGYRRQYYNGQLNYYDADPVSVTAGATTSVIDFALIECGQISGTVTDQSTGSPVSNMWVYAYDYDTGDYVSGANTDTNGNYTIQSLPSGNCRVMVYSHDDYSAQYYNGQLNYNDADPVSVTAGATTGGIDFALIEGGTISGRVTDAATGLGVADSYIEATDFSGSYYGSGNTDPDGYYSIGGLSSGSYRVGFYNGDYVFQFYNNVSHHHRDEANPVNVTIGSTTSGIDFSVVKGGSINGRVLDPNGLGVEGVWVAVHDYVISTDHINSTYTDSNGYYTVSQMPAGSFEVKVEPWGTNFVTQFYDHTRYWNMTSPVVVGPGEDVFGIDFDLEVGATVSGTITDPNGTAVEGAMVVCYQGSDWIRDAFSDFSGAYTISGIVPGQTYKFAAYPPEGVDTDYMNTKVDRFVGAGENDGVDIEFGSGGLTISGVVTDKSTGVPLEGVYVGCHIGDPYDFWGGDCRTDSNGYYELTGLPATEIYVWLDLWELPNRDDYGRIGGEYELTDDLTVDFDLPAAAGYSGFVIDMDTGEPVAGVEVEFYSLGYNTGFDSVTDSSGRFYIDQLPGGVFEVAAMPDVSSGYAFLQPCPDSYVYVPEGGNVENRYIPIQKGALVTGRFVQGDGVTPISFAEFEFSGDWFENWGYSDPNGEFAVRFPAGNYDIAIAIDDDEHSNHFMTVNIPDVATPVSLGDIVMYSVNDGGRISGSFSNPHGVAFTGEAEVIAVISGTNITPDNWGHYWETMWADISDTGEYTLGALPAGTYDVCLISWYERPDGGESAVLRDIVPGVVVADTSSVVSGIDLVYPSTGGTVNCSVENIYGEPIVGCNIILNDNTTGLFAGFTEVMQDGIFSIANVEPGNYTLTATHRMHQHASTTVTVSEGGVTDAGTLTLDFAGVRQGADINGDGIVDRIDVWLMSQQWLGAGPGADFNSDEIVDLADFNVLSQMWMSQAYWRD